MAIADITTGDKGYDNGIDSVVIRRYTGGIAGGRTLDVSEFSDEIIRAGHVVIFDSEKGNYKPLSVESGSYKALPSKHEYVGFVVASKPKDKPFVAILNCGEINEKALPYPLTDEMKKAIKEALPTIVFSHD